MVDFFLQLNVQLVSEIAKCTIISICFEPPERLGGSFGLRKTHLPLLFVFSHKYKQTRFDENHSVQWAIIRGFLQARNYASPERKSSSPILPYQVLSNKLAYFLPDRQECSSLWRRWEADLSFFVSRLHHHSRLWRLPYCMSTGPKVIFLLFSFFPWTLETLFR